jgi:hypothetical protein
VTATSTIALATVGILIGVENLGYLFTNGLQRRIIPEVLAGVVIVVLIALLFDLLLVRGPPAHALGAPPRRQSGERRALRRFASEGRMNLFADAFAWIFSRPPHRLAPLPEAIAQHLAFTFGSVLLAALIAIPPAGRSATPDADGSSPSPCPGGARDPDARSGRAAVSAGRRRLQEPGRRRRLRPSRSPRSSRARTPGSRRSTAPSPIAGAPSA